MSIWASLPACDGDHHTDECAVWDKHDNGVWERSGRPCSCGQPDAPLVYQGSHIVPSDTDERGGWVDLALIPSHITRDGKDDRDEDGPLLPYLRLGVNGETVILTGRNAREIHGEIGRWLDRISTQTERDSNNAAPVRPQDPGQGSEHGPTAIAAEPQEPRSVCVCDPKLGKVEESASRGNSR